MNDLTVKNFDFSVSADEAAKNNGGADAIEVLRRQIDEAVKNVTVFDIHTHLFAPQFGALNLWGIDELLNYHYLIAEMFRYSTIKPREFWQMSKQAQADLIWQTLFVENTPLSEATRGVVNVLSAFGLDARAKDLTQLREFFAAQKSEDFIDKVLKIANVGDVVMTNDPLDKDELKIWKSSEKIDARFHAALRLDRLLNNWTEAVPLIQEQNYKVSQTLDSQTISETRRFLSDWIETMKPLYLGVSLPDDFAYPEESARGMLFKEAIFPICNEYGVALSLMIGVRRKVNPALKLAGDGLGRADVSVLSRICEENPDVKILATFLSRENQHELCVVARKFSNLTPFGCWWFVNNSSIIAEITRERLEMLGTSFIPQHSDARILDQLIYKWNFSRRVIADALFDSYQNLLIDGGKISQGDIERDVEKLFAGNFKKLVGK